MPDSLGIPDSTDLPLEASGPDPSVAGAGWAAVRAGIDQAQQVFGGVQQLLDAHQETVDAAHLASIHASIDAQQSGLAAANPYDAGGYSEAASSARATFVKALPGRYAMQAGEYWDNRSQAVQATVAGQGMARTQQLAVQGLNLRDQQLSQSINDTFQSGAPLDLAWQSPVVQQGVAEQKRLRDQLVAAKAISPEEAAERARTDAQNWKAAAFTGHLLRTLQTQGASPALNELERVSKLPEPDAAADPNAWEAGQALTPEERTLMVAKGHAALTQAISLQDQQIGVAQTARLAAQRALDQRMQGEVDFQLHNGRASGAGPSDAEITAAYGAGKVADFAKQKADALEQNRDDGITPGMTSDQIAELAAHRAALKPLDMDLGTPEKQDALELAIRGQEGGVARDGTPLMSSQGALGGSQILVPTARGVARRLGLTAVAGMSDDQLHAALMSPDQRLNQQLGHAYYQQLVSKYGDPRLVSLAYHNGESQTDAAIGLYGRPDADVPYEQWLAKVAAGTPGKLGAMPKGAQYVQDVADRMQSAQRIASARAVVQRANEVTTAAVSDPLGFGQAHGWVQPTQLSLQGYAGAPDAQRQFGQALRARQDQAAVVAQQHAGVPPRMLTNAEASYYRDQIGADPTLGPKLASIASAALGGAGAAQLMHEVGQTDANASVGLQLGLLQTQGAAGQRVAAAATAGLADRQNGAKPAPLPKGETWEKAQADVAPAFENVPGVMAGVVQVAQLAHLHDSQGGHPDTPDAYIRAALGGARVPQGAFGGVAPVNGRPTLHPPNMLVGAMPRALQVVGDSLGNAAPRFTNGQPIRGKDLARMQAAVLPDGRYEVIDPRSGKYLTMLDGSRFELDFDAARPALARAGGIISAR